MVEIDAKYEKPVHCRTGSLENCDRCRTVDHLVHCRTGSLENTFCKACETDPVHCRTGSLESA